MYRVVYRDGRVGDPHPWERLLFFIGTAQRLPYPLRAACVIPDSTELEGTLT